MDARRDLAALARITHERATAVADLRRVLGGLAEELSATRKRVKRKLERSRRQRPA